MEWTWFLFRSFVLLGFYSSFSPFNVISLSGDEDHPTDDVPNLLGPNEPYLHRPNLSNHEEEEFPFRIVWQTSRFAPILAPMPILAPVPIRAFVGPESMVATVCTPTIVHFCSMYGISNHIKMSAPDPSDRVTSSPEGGVTIYEASSKQAFTYPFLHPYFA